MLKELQRTCYLLVQEKKDVVRLRSFHYALLSGDFLSESCTAPNRQGRERKYSEPTRDLTVTPIMRDSHLNHY